MSTSDLISGFALSLLAGFAAERGVDITGRLRDHGLAADRFDDPLMMVPVASVARVLNDTARAVGDPDFSIGYGEYFALRRASVLGQVQLTAPTIRDLVQVTAEFSPLALPALLSFEEHDGTAVLTGHMAPMPDTDPRQLVDFLLAILITRIRRGAGGRWTPLAVDLIYRRPHDLRALEQLAGSALRFAESAIRIEFSSATLDIPFPDIPVGPFEMTCAYLRSLRERVPHNDHAAEAATRREIMRRLADDASATLDRVAAAMGRSSRSLQAQLHQEGSNFETVLLEIRLELAAQHLRDSDLPMSEIALRLGFAGPSVLSRWVLTHFGATPTKVRRRLREEFVTLSPPARANPKLRPDGSKSGNGAAA